MNQFYIILTFIFVFVIALLCGALASSKNRDAVLWTVIGLITLGFGLLVLLVLPEGKSNDLIKDMIKTDDDEDMSEEDEMDDVKSSKKTSDPLEKKMIPNYTYYTSSNFRVCQVEFTRKGKKHMAQLVARSYQNMGIESLKTKLKVYNIFGEEVSISEITFDFGEKDEVGWHISSRETIRVDEIIKLSTIRSASVEVIEVRWMDQGVEKVNQKYLSNSKSIGKVKTLRKAFGADVFSDFIRDHNVDGYYCICGYHNQHLVNHCGLCGRARDLIETSKPKGGIIELLNNCQTIEDAEEVISEQAGKIPKAISDKLLVKMQQDQKEKEKSDKFNDKEKIDKYIEIAMELLVKG